MWHPDSPLPAPSSHTRLGKDSRSQDLPKLYVQYIDIIVSNAIAPRQGNYSKNATNSGWSINALRPGVIQQQDGRRQVVEVN